MRGRRGSVAEEIRATDEEATETGAVNSPLNSFSPSQTNSGQSSAAVTTGLPNSAPQPVTGFSGGLVYVRASTAKLDAIDTELFETFTIHFASKTPSLSFRKATLWTSFRAKSPNCSNVPSNHGHRIGHGTTRAVQYLEHRSYSGVWQLVNDRSAAIVWSQFRPRPRPPSGTIPRAVGRPITSTSISNLHPP